LVTIHNDFYSSVLYEASKTTKNGQVFQYKYVVLKSLQEFDHPKVTALIAKLEEWRILPLMTFQMDWNEEILYQFWATLWVDQACHVLHWMTQGVHYRLDFITFSHLLGFDRVDRDAPFLSHLFTEGISEDDLATTEIYKPSVHSDFKTTHLKPYLYVLNNLIRYTIDPKFGDSIHLHIDDLCACGLPSLVYIITSRVQLSSTTSMCF